MTTTTEQGSANPLLAVRRRLRPLMLAVGIVLLATVLAAVFWPARYTAAGTILIEQQELPSDMVRSAVSSYASQRIQTISQRVMTTENLLNIIQRYNLYADMRKRHPREEVIKEMRADTVLKMISADVIDPRDGHPTKATIAFSISYTSPSSELAAKVANELVSLYLQQNIETRQQISRDAAVFLADESTRLSKDINELQAKIAKFKEKHADELPELSGFNQQKTTRIDEEIRDTDSQLRALRQQVTFLDAQLAKINPTAQIFSYTGERVQSPADRLKYLRTEYARTLALYSPDHPDVLRLKREMDGLEAATEVDADIKKSEANDDRRALEDAQTQLASAKQRYGPDHPDVIRAQRLVDSLQSHMASTSSAASPDQGAAPQSSDKNAAALNGDNPPYIQLQSQRKAATSQIDSLEQKRDELQREMNTVERHLADTPVVERDYTAMLRDLDAAQIEYRQVREKQIQAQTSQNLEVERKGERFTLIEPPFAPEQPSSPNRPLILIFGFMLALAAGFGTVAVLEATDGSVRGRGDLVELLDAAPLAMIPVMLTDLDRARQRRWRRGVFAGGVASILLALLLVHLLYRPLDVLWSVVMRRFGIEA